MARTKLEYYAATSKDHLVTLVTQVLSHAEFCAWVRASGTPGVAYIFVGIRPLALRVAETTTRRLVEGEESA